MQVLVLHTVVSVFEGIQVVPASSSVLALQKHIKEHHEEVRERPCPHPGCNKVFMIDRYLQRHVKLIHTGVSPQVTGHRWHRVWGAEALGAGWDSLCAWNEAS